jgi:transposase
MRAKITQLEEAFTGHFTDHHRFLLGKMLARIDTLDADIAELESTIEEMVAPFVLAVDTLDEIPGIGTISAQVIIAEIGVDMSPIPHRCPPGLLGPLRPRNQGISRPQER